MPTTEALVALLVDGTHGRYIGQELARRHGQALTYEGAHSACKEDLAILEAGPDHEHYGEAYDAVLAKAVVIDDGLTVYARWRLVASEHGGDVFLVHPDADTEGL